ncbi:hypothetical protein Gotur_013930 [Gossypium turneri]
MGPSSAPMQEPTSMATLPLGQYVSSYSGFFWTFVPGVLHAGAIDIFDDTDDDAFAVYNLSIN